VSRGGRRDRRRGAAWPCPRSPSALGLDLAPGQERGASGRAAVRAVAVVRHDELVRHLERNGIAGAPPSRHDRTV